MMRKRDTTIWRCDICGYKIEKTYELSPKSQPIKQCDTPAGWMKLILPSDSWTYLLVCKKHNIKITIDEKELFRQEAEDPQRMI